jgi:hypothetical protein
VSTRLLLRILILFIAAWSLLLGLILVGFQGAGAGALGAGVTDAAGQRLAGAQMLAQAPFYALIAWRLQRFQAFVWLPIAGQAAIALTVGYSLVARETAIADGLLACALSAFFAGLLAFLWVTEQRSLAAGRVDAGSGVEIDAADEGKL